MEITIPLCFTVFGSIKICHLINSMLYCIFVD
nr:MAG TPA: hypothetical protein [Caudoviricetes sp.]